MKIENAIVMAAGLGSRLRPLTLSTPKPLLKVHGTPMIETVIRTLRDAGVQRIFVVVGYLGEQFNYLAEKYENLTVLVNPDYQTVNNISSIFAAKDVLLRGNCLICEADLFVREQLPPFDMNRSGYFGRKVSGYSDDWVFEQNATKRITRVGKGGTDCYNMVGFSYFTATDAKTLCNCITAAYARNDRNGLFWDDVVNAHLDTLDLTVFPIPQTMITEIDTVEEYDAVNAQP